MTPGFICLLNKKCRNGSSAVSTIKRPSIRLLIHPLQTSSAFYSWSHSTHLSVSRPTCSGYVSLSLFRLLRLLIALQNHSTPLLLIRDSYESTVLTAFFYLLLTYLSPSTDEQKAIFLKVGLSRHADREARRKGGQPRKWVFPLSFIKTKPAVSLSS